MKGEKVFLSAGILAPFLIATGGIIYAVTGMMGSLPLAFIWAGLLLLLLFFYTNFSAIRDFVSLRSARYGANMALMIVVFLVIIGLIGTMSVRYKMRVDLTETKRYTLSQQTIKILRSLKRDVEAVAFYRGDERTRQAMFDLLKEYSYYSPRFKFWFIDPDRRPAEAARYGVTSYRTTLIRSGNKQEIVGFESEEKMTNALLKITRDEVKAVYFVKGHGENSINDLQKNGYKAAKEAIEKENYQVRELLLMGVDAVPEDTSVLVVSGPEKDFLLAELERITNYVNRGGKVLFMLDPGKLLTLSQYLKGYGFELGDDIIVDKLGQVFGANYLTPVVTEYNKKHPVTQGFNIATFFPVARSVEIEEDSTRGNYNLAKTGPGSWAVKEGELNDKSLEFNPGRDRKGPISLGAVAAVEAKEGVEEKKAGSGVIEEGMKRWGKIVVLGDSDFANNTHINLAGNRDLFLNTINWLAEETDLISIRKKGAGITPLTLTATQGKLAFWLSVIIVPSLVIIIGIGVTTRKRWGG